MGQGELDSKARSIQQCAWHMGEHTTHMINWQWERRCTENKNIVNCDSKTNYKACANGENWKKALWITQAWKKLSHVFHQTLILTSNSYIYTFCIYSNVWECIGRVDIKLEREGKEDLRKEHGAGKRKENGYSKWKAAGRWGRVGGRSSKAKHV